MNTKKVVTNGGGENLFKVSEYRGKFYVYKVKVGFISDSSKEIGSAGSFEDALYLIKSYTGRGIDKIRDW
ncbi:MAG: hypothetical protein GXO85_10740 [Chlorobi bacterium]|nr:hypothetical protein [Chlorobiota bacterium]